MTLAVDDNRDLCSAIKAARGRRLPIIMVLSDGSVDAHVKMIDAGADASLVEPVFPNELLDEMSRLLGSQAEPEGLPIISIIDRLPLLVHEP